MKNISYKQGKTRNIRISKALWRMLRIEAAKSNRKLGEVVAEYLQGAKSLRKNENNSVDGVKS